jgi:hypothetical protein
MNIYQGKERRVSTADRRVKTVDGTGHHRRNGAPERRAKTIDDMIACYATESPNPSDTAELLKKYREALISAYELGQNIRETYGIVPPKVLHGNWTLPNGDKGNPYTISLQVS